MVKMWLDDFRLPPVGWTHVRSVNRAIALLDSGEVTEASLDHDMGRWYWDGGSGYRVANYIVENDLLPSSAVSCHSLNRDGKARIELILATRTPYYPEVGLPRPAGIPLNPSPDPRAVRRLQGSPTTSSE